MQVDPVEVRKRQTVDRAKDAQGFAAERARIESELRDAQVSQLMSEAAQIVKAQVLAQVRKLETDGDFKKLPADWAANRPNWESIAQKVVDGIKTSRGVTIALPTVVSKSGSWLTEDELTALAVIMSGEEPPQKEGQNHGLRAAVLKRAVGRSLEVQSKLMMNPQIREVYQARLEYHENQVQQQQNAIIGRTMRQPVLGEQ